MPYIAKVSTLPVEKIPVVPFTKRRTARKRDIQFCICLSYFDKASGDFLGWHYRVSTGTTKRFVDYVNRIEKIKRAFEHPKDHYRLQIPTRYIRDIERSYYYCPYDKYPNCTVGIVPLYRLPDNDDWVIDNPVLFDWSKK